MTPHIRGVPGTAPKNQELNKLTGINSDLTVLTGQPEGLPLLALPVFYCYSRKAPAIRYECTNLSDSDIQLLISKSGVFVICRAITKILSSGRRQRRKRIGA
jgi:hypothetical protein